VRQAEVNKFDVALWINDDVIRFEISIDNSFLMEVLQGQDYFTDVELGYLLT